MTTPSKLRRLNGRPKGVLLTKSDLILTFSSIIKIQAELPVAYEIAKMAYDRWMRNNDPEIKAFWKRRSEIDMEYFVNTEKDGQVVYEYEGEGEDQTPVLKKGKQREDHQKSCEELLKEPVTIIP